MLISVIRSLTSSVSEDQRVLERARLSEGFKRSEQLIDNLVKGLLCLNYLFHSFYYVLDHQNDVEECLDSFRDVSTKVSGFHYIFYIFSFCLPVELSGSFITYTMK